MIVVSLSATSMQHNKETDHSHATHKNESIKAHGKNLRLKDPVSPHENLGVLCMVPPTVSLSAVRLFFDRAET